MSRLRPPGLEALFIATLALFGFRLGATPIGDNSTFVHLRTGIDLVAGQGIPRRDPYSFTAAGEPWVVQSWLASAIYGAVERLGGLSGVVVLQAVLMAALALLVVLLARAGSPLRTGAAGAVALGVGAAYWVPRPLLLGLLCLALLVTAVERRWPAWVLLPVLWMWVNAHGTFPLALAWLGLRAAGEWLDHRRAPRHLAPYGLGVVAGLALSALNPLGPRLLAFPVTALDRRDELRTLIEWRTPDFNAPDGLFALAFIALALLALARGRVPWRHALPGVAFLAAGLLALRNIPAAGVVLAPALGAALAAGSRAATSEPSPQPEPPRLNLAIGGVVAAAFVIFAAAAWTGPALDLDQYPVGAVAWLDDEGMLGPDTRLAHDILAGSYLILRDGRDAHVFIDDRLDMYPARVSRDLDVLIAGGGDAVGVLDRHAVAAVLWRAAGRLPATLLATGAWSEAYTDDAWVVLTRR